jgi:serine/threonine-protein kinase RsbT
MLTVEDEIVAVLRAYLSDVVARAIARRALEKALVDPLKAGASDGPRIARSLDDLVSLWIRDPERRAECTRRLADLLKLDAPAAGTLPPGQQAAPAPGGSPAQGGADLQTIPINEESDVLRARTACRDVCEKLGFSMLDQVKIATAVSELARNIVAYAGRGTIDIAAIHGKPRAIDIVARDQGPGIPNLDQILAGLYKSRTGLGMGLRGVKRLMDHFDIQTGPGRGTQVTLRKVVR